MATRTNLSLDISAPGISAPGTVPPVTVADLLPCEDSESCSLHISLADSYEPGLVLVLETESVLQEASPQSVQGRKRNRL